MDEVLAKLGHQRITLRTVNQYFTAGKVIALSDLITILPFHLLAATGMSDLLVSKKLPFPLPELNVDMLWHERDARSQPINGCGGGSWSLSN